MAATTEWNIAQLERHLADGAIYIAHWTVNLEDQGESAGAYGSVGFSDPDPDAFTPYDQLTKEQVVGWVKDALGEEQVTSVEESLANQIQQKLDPADASGICLLWPVLKVNLLVPLIPLALHELLVMAILLGLPSI